MKRMRAADCLQRRESRVGGIVPVAVEQDEVEAGRRQRTGDAETDTLARAGDGGDRSPGASAD